MGATKPTILLGTLGLGALCVPTAQAQEDTRDTAERALTLQYLGRTMDVFTQPSGIDVGSSEQHMHLELGVVNTSDGQTGAPGVYGIGMRGDVIGGHAIVLAPEIAMSQWTVVAAGIEAYPGPIELGVDAELYPSAFAWSAARLRASHEPIADSRLRLAVVVGDQHRWAQQEGDAQLGPLQVFAHLVVAGRFQVGTEYQDVGFKMVKFPISTSLWALVGPDNLPEGRNEAPLFNLRLRATLANGGYGVEGGPSWLVHANRGMGGGGWYAFATASHYTFSWLGVADPDLDTSGLDDLSTLGTGWGVEAGFHLDFAERDIFMAHVDPYEIPFKFSAWYNYPGQAMNGAGHVSGAKIKFLF